MFEFLSALVVVCAVCYGAIRGARNQIARTKTMKRDKEIADYRLLIANRAHRDNIPLGDAEHIIIGEGNVPPVGWGGYSPRS